MLITIRKCGRWSDHFHAGIRDIDREVGPPVNDASGNDWQALDREPTPGEVLLLDEAVEQLLHGLTERDAAIVARSLQGYTVAEVSDQLNLTTRTV